MAKDGGMVGGSSERMKEEEKLGLDADLGMKEMKSGGSKGKGEE